MTRQVLIINFQVAFVDSFNFASRFHFGEVYDLKIRSGDLK